MDTNSELEELDALFEMSEDEDVALDDEKSDDKKKEGDTEALLKEKIAKLEKEMKIMKEKLSEKETSKENSSQSISDLFNLDSGKCLKDQKRPNNSVEKRNNFSSNNLLAKKRRIGCLESDLSHKHSQSSKIKNLFASSQPSNNAGCKFEVETYSRIRLKSRKIDNYEMKKRMEGKLFIKTSDIYLRRNSIANKDWVTIGVVVKQLNPQTSKNGKKFSVLHLSDLDDCTKSVSLFLFSSVHSELYNKLALGDVVGLLNPSIMPPKTEESSNKSKHPDSSALTVDTKERILVIGQSADLGWCKATRYANKSPVGRCQSFINTQFGSTCIFHMQKTYKKVGATRGELQGVSQAPVANKYKNTLWNKVKKDQFFYGGQLFNAVPTASGSNNKKTKENQTKLTTAFKSLEDSTKIIDETKLKRQKVIQSLGKLKEDQVVSGCSTSFTEMLGSGDYVHGSRQFLAHLRQKKEAEEIKKKSTSSIQLLKEYQQRHTQPQKPVNESKKDVLPSKSQIESNTSRRIVPDNHKDFAEEVARLKKERMLLRMQKKREQKSANTDSNNKTSNNKTSNNKTSNNKTSNNKTSDSKTSNNKTSNNKTSNNKTSNSKTSNNKTSNNKTSDNKTSNSKTSDNKTSNNKTSNNKTSDSKTSNNKTSNNKTSDNKTSDSTINFISSKDFHKTSQDLINKMITKKTKSSESLVASKESLQKTIDANNKLLDFGRSPLNGGSLSIADFKKQRAIAKLKSGSVSIRKKDPNNVLLQRVKMMKDNKKLKEKIRRKVEEDQKKKNVEEGTDKTEEQMMQDTPVTSALSVLMSNGRMSREEFNEILQASSSHTDTLNEAEIERQEKYFNPKIKKEMMEAKMGETFEVSTKVVTCHTCDYTFWGPHERCKTLAHRLTWKDCKKQFWECSNCQQRTTTWQPYPAKSCWGCGNVKTWRKTSMLIPKKGKKLESEILLIRGIEHSRFLNSLK